MNKPLVSVIIPVYKVEKYLDRCIDSVVNQSYRNLEIILVDDGSPDSCPQICDEWAKKDCRIKVIHKENGGLSSARNAGLDVCGGEYISFVDSDDWIEPNYYNITIPYMQKHNAEIGCVGRYDVDSKSMIKKLGLCPVSSRTISIEEMMKKMWTWDECDSAVWDKVFSSYLWKNIRFPVGIICEDVAVTYRVVDCATNILMISEPMYNYFHREGSITTAAFSSKSMHVTALADEICEYVKIHHPNIFEEAKYFKFKTLLHWNRAYAKQDNPSPAEIDLNRSSRVWLRNRFFWVLFLSKYISLKDKLWYILIVFGMKKTIRNRIG